jgi:hypothetical protein
VWFLASQTCLFRHLGRSHVSAALPVGLPAVVFQHEYDHMDGVMHSDREAQAYSQGNRQELVAVAVKKYMAQLLHHYNIVIPSSAISPADF